MITGLGTYASDQYNTNLVLDTKNTEDNLLTQTTSGKKSINYAGIADSSQQVLNLSGEQSSVSNFLTNNNTVNLSLQAMTQVYSSVQSQMSTFQQDLQNFVNNSQEGNASDQQTLQQQAFAALKNMQYYLNTQVDGQYIFSGSNTTTPPLQFDFSTLSQFQAAYDGYNTQYPTTGAADLSQTQTSVLQTGSVSFNGENGTITAANVGQFSNLPVGSVVSLSGSPYNGQYTILSNNGTTISVAPGFAAEGDPSSGSYTQNVSITTSSQAAQNPSLDLQPNGVAFSPPGVMTSQTPGQFSSLQAGDSITISGAADPANNGNFIVASVDPSGTTLSIQRPQFTSTANLDATTADTSATVSLPSGTATTTLDDTTNGINFNANGTISDNVGGALLGSVPVGSYITVANAAQTANDGTYLVTANNSGVLSVQSSGATSLTNEAANTSAQITNGTATAFTPGSLSFDAGSSTISAANAGSLQGIEVGQTVNIAGSNSNNGDYTVTGTFTTPVVDEANNLDAQITDGTTSFAGTATGGITFDAGTDSLSAANVGSLAGVNVGDVINVSGSADNNGAFVVTAIDPTDSVVTVAPADSVVQVASNVSLSTSSYYQGNSATVSQQIDNNTTLPFGITASNPAFEKAIRAMALVAEGQTGTAGGLDMNSSRLTAANYLIGSAMDDTTTGTAPYGTESQSNMNSLSQTLALQQEQLSSVTTTQNSFQNFLTTQVGNLTNADSTQTIVELLDQQEALQASYQSLSSVRQLSLLNYLK
jgi:flagellin-like hook-associated protein FlgL